MSEVVLEVQNLSKHYSSAIRAVDGLTFSVRRGQIFGLLGPNGAGKTTTLKMLTTLVRPSGGRAAVMGFDVVENPLEVRRRISSVVQETAAEIFLTVRDNLLTFARFHGVPDAARRAAEVLERMRLTAETGRKVQDLSGGFRRRVQVAKVFMVDTPVVFLDEFSTGMDPLLKRSVMEALRDEAARGRTIVLTTQVLSEAEELCDDILIIHKGRQVARGDLHTLKLLTAGVYEIALTYSRLPEGIEAVAAALAPLRLRVAQNTVELALKDGEAAVLDAVTRLGRAGHLLRLEVSGASLEDVFLELTKEA